MAQPRGTGQRGLASWLASGRDPACGGPRAHLLRPERLRPRPRPARSLGWQRQRQRQRLGQRRRSGVPGRASSRDHHEFGDPDASTRASGRWERRPRHYGPSGHRLAPRRSTAVHDDHPPSGRRDAAAWRRPVERRQPGQAARRGGQAARQRQSGLYGSPARAAHTSFPSGQAGVVDVTPTPPVAPTVSTTPLPPTPATAEQPDQAEPHLAVVGPRLEPPIGYRRADRRLARGQPRAGHQRTRHRTRPDPGPHQPPGCRHRAAPHSGDGRGHGHQDRHPRRGAQGPLARPPTELVPPAPPPR